MLHSPLCSQLLLLFHYLLCSWRHWIFNLLDVSIHCFNQRIEVLAVSYQINGKVFAGKVGTTLIFKGCDHRTFCDYIKFLNMYCSIWYPVATYGHWVRWYIFIQKKNPDYMKKLCHFFLCVHFFSLLPEIKQTIVTQGLFVNEVLPFFILQLPVLRTSLIMERKINIT